jgi:hypothetical protein
VFQVLELAPLTNKQICSLAFECQPQTDFPILSWNVTLPDTPKPTPRPPQPPSVSRILFFMLQITEIFNRLLFYFKHSCFNSLFLVILARFT